MLALTGAGSSSLAASNSSYKAGRLKFFREGGENDVSSKFIYSVGGSSLTQTSGSNGNEIKPNELIKNLSFYSSSIPLLVEGFAIQTAKHIFDGSLFKGTRYSRKVKSAVEKSLQAKKQKIENWLKKRKEMYPKRIKKEWIHDERWYLTSLKDFVISKIDEQSMLDYFEIKEHLMNSKKIKKDEKDKLDEKFIPLITFFITAWIKRHKAGFYVHEVIPYSESFTENMKKLYEDKYKGIFLPQRPNYFFPDYEISKEGENKFQKLIKEWQEGRLHYPHWYSLRPIDRDEDLIKKTNLLWIKKSNTSHQNLALRLLSDGMDDKEQKEEGSASSRSSTWRFYLSKLLSGIVSYGNSTNYKCNYEVGSQNDNHNAKNGIIKIFNKLWNDEQENPMKLFCLDKASDNHPEFLLFQIHKDNFEQKRNISKKILFYRNHEGFNIIYPITQNIIEAKKKEEKEPHTNDENKVKERKLKFFKDSNLLSEFKSFVKENFPQLILRYRFIVKNSSGDPRKIKCCCDEIIKNLLILLQIGRKLSDWSEIWKSYDIRRTNNEILSGEGNEYFHKLGTVSANPPEFLTERLKKDLSQISKLKNSVETYMKEISNYFSDQSSEIKKEESQETVKLQAEKQTGGRSNSKHYWTFQQVSQEQEKNKEQTSTKNQWKTCIKREVAEYLLEKISRKKLIKDFLALPISFKSSIDWVNKNNGIVQVSSSSNGQSNGKDVKNFMGEKFSNYFKKIKDNNGNGNEPPALIKEIIKTIDQELILSELSEIPDTTIFNLLKVDSKEEKNNNEEKSLENIKNYLTLINLNNPKKNRLNEKLRILITVLYLIENSFTEYREWIRNVIKREGYGVYAFSLSWNKFCNKKYDEFDPMNKLRIDSFWTPYPTEENSKEWNTDKFDSRQCIETMDRYSSTAIKKNLSSNADLFSIAFDFLVNLPQLITAKSNKNFSQEELMGFKGIVSEDMMNTMPENISQQLGQFLSQEGYINWKEIKSQIKLLNTNRNFADYIDKLKKIKPSIETAFSLPDYKNLKEDVSKAKETEVLEYLQLKEKRDLLEKFIDESILNEQLDALSEGGKMIEIDFSSTSKDQKRFQGLIKNSESKDSVSYTFNHTNEDLEWLTSSSYLLQITTDDLKDENTFYNFANNFLTPQMLLQDVVKQARIKSLQTKAINHFLNRGKWANNQQVNILRSSDAHLEKQFTTIIL